jgi:hypothetical protein
MTFAVVPQHERRACRNRAGIDQFRIECPAGIGLSPKHQHSSLPVNSHVSWIEKPRRVASGGRIGSEKQLPTFSEGAIHCAIRPKANDRIPELGEHHGPFRVNTDFHATTRAFQGSKRRR